MSKTIIGIDLGTTNSEVAVIRAGNLEIVEEADSPILPSCVGLAEDGSLVVGAAARNQYILRPGHTVRSAKRKMATDTEFKLGDRSFSPTEISAFILKELKTRAERALGKKVDSAVITVPAYFNDAQRQATRDAGVMAGLEVERILNEPTAAALAYEAEGVEKVKTVLVYDLGGGTFDASIVRMEKDLVEVLGSHGDNLLGGDDVDELLYQRALESFLEENPEKSLDASGTNRLHLSVEELKTRLSESAASELSENALACEGDNEPASLQWDVDRNSFESWVTPLLSGTLQSVRTVLNETGLSATDLDEILLVGGATRMPIVSDLLERELNRRPRADLHPDLAVAYGAGVMAARLMGDQQHRILVDVTPYTFGTSCIGEVNGQLVPYYYEPIIKAGTPIPARRGRVFYTMCPGQEIVEVRVFQGESRDSRENIFIGDFKVKNLDFEADEGSEILLNMNLNIDGILHVTAVERHTGLTKSVVIKNATGAQSKTSLKASQKRIEELFSDETPLDVIDITEPEEAKEAEQPKVQDELLKRIEVCMPELDETDQQDMNRARDTYLQAQNTGDDLASENARLEIEDILFYIESK